jgi:hypothetical protein
MLKRLLILSLNAVLATTMLACGPPDVAGGTPDAGDGFDSGPRVPSLIEGRECPPDNATTYANTGAPILTSWCTPCHSSHVPANQRQHATMGVNFDTVEGIQDQLLRIYARAGDDNDTMPPIDSLSADERQRLGDWIACGAPGLEDAILPEPGDGGLVPDMGGGGPPGRRDAGMQGGRDTGVQGGRDTGGTPPDPEGCTEDADCDAECARAPMGCSCVERRGGTRACVRNCEDDDDCPGNTLVCVEQLCQRP